MNPWTKLREDFNALMEAEDRIVLERLPLAPCYGYVTYGESGEVGCWVEDVSKLLGGS
jgi:hypothetical protein